MTNRKPMSPEDHRATIGQQSDSQPKGNARPYRSSHWPQAERLRHDIGGSHMILAMTGWRSFNAAPVMCVANDNYIEPEDAEAGEEQERRFDNRLDHDTADRTVALHSSGKSWQPGEERFTRPHRNDRAKAAPGPGQYKANGVEIYQLEADAEDEANRAIDCTSARRRLGHVCCRLLDLASGDSTTEEIAAAVKQPGSDRTPIWIDWSIIQWMRDDSYRDYANAA